MSYYENLRGVLQTKLDALNAMDHFSNVARMTKDMAPERAEGKSVAHKSGAWGFVMAGASVLLVLAAIAAQERKS